MIDISTVLGVLFEYFVVVFVCDCCVIVLETLLRSSSHSKAPGFQGFSLWNLDSGVRARGGPLAPDLSEIFEPFEGSRVPGL